MKKIHANLVIAIMSLLLTQSTFAMGGSGGGGGGHGMGDSSSGQMHGQPLDKNQNAVHTEQEMGNDSQLHVNPNDQDHNDMDNNTHLSNPAPNIHHQGLQNTGD